MNIKLLGGATDIQFEHKRVRYLLQASPKLFRPTIGEVVAEGVKPGFIYGRVSLLVLARRPFRIRREYRVSEDYDHEGSYVEALKSGFDVRQGAAAAARLLVGVGLAELVSKERK
jgi:hypothetical protein